jgi:hypothetical protein
MPTLPEISKITIPSGTYALKDEVARSMAAGGIQLKGETTTALTDMATTNPIVINGESYTAVNQDAVFSAFTVSLLFGNNADSGFDIGIQRNKRCICILYIVKFSFTDRFVADISENMK